MTNKEIAIAFRDLGAIMELHGENPFKTKSYNNAYRNLRSLDKPLNKMTNEEIGALKGVGKAIQGKIGELLSSGKMETMEKYKSITPPGIVELLSLKGFGPKKIRQFWKELQIESPGELLYACEENRIIELKGFSQKSQTTLKNAINFMIAAQGFFRYGDIAEIAELLVRDLKEAFSEQLFELIGEISRKCNVVNAIEILTTEKVNTIADRLALTEVELQENIIKGIYQETFPVVLKQTERKTFGLVAFENRTEKSFFDEFSKKYSMQEVENEKLIFEQNNLPFVVPEYREGADRVGELPNQPNLIEVGDIKGVIHSHTTFSDGANTLEQMVKHSKKLGYQYILITDHSQAAFYANGLKPDRLEQQWLEIDALNKSMKDFKILKGIESDILFDGSLDYEDAILEQFDCIIASVHSVLKMSEEKATSRLITAIENPHTHILGHPTGRILLTREGYPIDHKKVIDACAANKVSIEINASPYRLDLDWKWLPYALEKGVMISVNPDAHSLEGIEDIKWGIAAARKGGLTAEMCLNAYDVATFLEKIQK